MSTMSERLQYLLETHRRPNGKKWSIRQIVTNLNERGYTQINRQIVAGILNGDADDPRLSHLQALADFFAVPVAYFYEPDHPLAKEEALISEAMRDANIQRIVLEMAGLQKAGRAQVAKLYPVMLKLIEEVRSQEQGMPSENGSTH
jgi:transcriptional regulator with XRE-family HTH domain